VTETSSAQPSLSTMRLAELQSLAGSMGLKGISRMRKSELVAAIRDGGASDDSVKPPASADNAVSAVSGAESGAETPATEPAGKRVVEGDADDTTDSSDSSETRSTDAQPSRVERAADEPAQSRPRRRRPTAAASRARPSISPPSAVHS